MLDHVRNRPSRPSPTFAPPMYANVPSPLRRWRIGTGWISGHHTRHAGGEEAGVLEGVHERVLERRVVERRDVPEVEEGEPQHDERDRARERAQPPLDRLQAARGRAHDHARERQQQEQRRDVAEQDVLGHVHREEVLLAEGVDRRHEGDQQHEDAAGERDPLPPAGAAAAGSRRAARKRQTYTPVHRASASRIAGSKVQRITGWWVTAARLWQRGEGQGRVHARPPPAAVPIVADEPAHRPAVMW